MDELLLLVALLVGVAAIVIALEFRRHRSLLIRKIEDEARENSNPDEEP